MPYTYQEDFSQVKAEFPKPLRVDYFDIPSGRPGNWSPDADEEPMPEVTERTPVAWYDFDQLSSDQAMVLILKGAEYRIRRQDQDGMKLWCSRGGANRRPVPFVGHLKHFGFVDTAEYHPNHRSVDFYPKLVALLNVPDLISHVAMPYFDFNADGALQPPSDIWMGSVQSIQVGQLAER